MTASRVAICRMRSGVNISTFLRPQDNTEMIVQKDCTLELSICDLALV